MIRGWVLLVAIATGTPSETHSARGPSDEDRADIAALRVYDYGDDRAPLVRLEASVRASLDQTETRDRFERLFVSIIDSTDPPGAKDFAFRQLAIVVSEASAPRLGAWLLDADHHHASRRVLEGLKATWAGDVLANALADVDEPRLEIGLLGSLAARRDGKHLPIVLRHIDHANPDVAEAAIDALGALASPSEFPVSAGDHEQRFTRALLEAATRELTSDDRRTIVFALARILEGSQGVTPSEVAALTTWFALSPQSALDTALRWLESEHRLGRQTSAGLLQRLSAGDPLLEQVVHRLEQIEDDHPDLFLDMAVRHGPDSLARIVRRAIDEDLAPERRVAAIRALGRAELTAETVDVLVDLAAYQRDIRRTAARESLTTARGAVTDRLCDRLGDPEWEIRTEAARLLGQRGETSRVHALVDALDDDNDRVRVSAWDALARVAGGPTYLVLCQKLFETRTARERTSATRAIAAVARRFDPETAAIPRHPPTTLLDSDGHRFRTPLEEWQIVGDVELRQGKPTRLDAKSGTGVLTNGEDGRTRHLVSRSEYGDVRAHVEFLVPRGSNSGVYFMGRYELQILDSYGREDVSGSDCGGIYQRWKNGKGYEGHPPRVNASKPAGQWQTFDVAFRAPEFDASGKKIANAMFLEVLHNGVAVHRNIELTGPTRAAMFDEERPTGPLLLQGDHGPVAFRNVSLGRLPSRADERARPILENLEQSDDDTRAALRATAFSVLSSIGGDEAFAALSGIVTEDVEMTRLYGGDLDARRAAIRALADWPGDQPLETLLGAIRAQPDSKIAAVALRGALRQLRSSERSDDDRLERYREVAALATNADSRRSLLSGLGELGQSEALDLIAPHMNDESVRMEAAVAALRVCEEIVTTHADVVTDWIPRIEDILGQTARKRVAVVRAGLDLLKAVISKWRLSGPYQQANTEGDALLDIAFSPEDPDATSEWREIRADRGKVDLSAILGGSHRCAYLETIVYSETNVRARLELGSDDGVAVWLNGERVHRNASARPFSLGQDRVMVTLEKGANRLLLKVTQIGGDWAAGGRFLNMEGAPLEGIRFEVK